MKKIGLLIGILLIGMVSYGQSGASMWERTPEGVCDSSIVENKYVCDISKFRNDVYFGVTNSQHYTFMWEGKKYILAYRKNDNYCVKQVNNWREERDILLYRYEGVGNWVLACNDIIRTDWRTAEKYDVLLAADFDDNEKHIFVTKEKIVIQLLTGESDYYTHNYYHERIELIPDGRGMFKIND
jgi:hypothetical protein